jgi:hypothetical protein
MPSPLDVEPFGARLPEKGGYYYQYYHQQLLAEKEVGGTVARPDATVTATSPGRLPAERRWGKETGSR